MLDLKVGLKKTLIYFCVFTMAVNQMLLLPVSVAKAAPDPIRSDVFAGMKLAPGGEGEAVLDVQPSSGGGNITSIKITVADNGSSGFATSDLASVKLYAGPDEIPTNSVSWVGSTYTITPTDPANTPTGSTYKVVVAAASGAVVDHAFKVGIEASGDVTTTGMPSGCGIMLTIANVTNAVTIGTYPSTISGTVHMPGGVDHPVSGQIKITLRDTPSAYDQDIDLTAGAYSKSLPNGIYNVYFYGLADYSAASQEITVNNNTQTANFTLAANSFKATGAVTAGESIVLANIQTFFATKVVDGTPVGSDFMGTITNDGGNYTYSVTVPESADYVLGGDLSGGENYLLTGDGFNHPGMGPQTLTISGSVASPTSMPAIAVMDMMGGGDPGPGSGGAVMTPYVTIAETLTEQHYAKAGTAVTLQSAEGVGTTFGTTQGTKVLKIVQYSGQSPVTLDISANITAWADDHVTFTVPASSSISSGELQITDPQNEQNSMMGGDFVFYHDNEGVLTGSVAEPTGEHALVTGGNVSVFSKTSNYNNNGMINANGTFAVGPLAIGQIFEVTASPSFMSPSDFGQSVSINVTITTEGANIVDGDSEVSEIQPIYLTEANITGTVKNPSAASVSNVMVNIHDQNWTNRAFGQTTSDGSFKIGGLADGTYTIDLNLPPTSQFSAPAGMNVTLVDGAVTTAYKSAGTPGQASILSSGSINIVLESPQMVGKIAEPVGVSQAGVPDVYISVHRMTYTSGVGCDTAGNTCTDDWSSQIGANTNSDGIFRLGGMVENGWYKLEARPSPQSPYSSPTPLVFQYTGTPIDYTSEGTHIHLTTPQVRGIVTDGTNPIPNNPVGIHNADWTVSQWSGADQQGAFVFGGLTDGDYTIEAEPPFNNTTGMMRASAAVNIAAGAVTAASGSGVTFPNGSGGITIALSAATKFITGIVKYANNDPVTNAFVNAWKNGGGGWANKAVDPDGTFSLPVPSSGDWNVMVEPDRQNMSTVDWVFGGQPYLVTVGEDADDYPEGGLTYTVTGTDATVTGNIYIGATGTTAPPQNTVFVNLSNRANNTNFGSPVQADGSYTFNVPYGQYELNVNSKNYSIPSDYNTAVKVTTTGTLTLDSIRLSTKSEFITGAIKDSNGSPIADFNVFAFEMNGHGFADAITDDNGLYTLAVGIGRWQVQPNQDPDSDYIMTVKPSEIVVTAGQTVSALDITMQTASATINGRLVDPNNADATRSTITDGYVWMDKHDGGFGGGGQIRNGTFTIKTTPDTYNIGVGFPPGSPYNATRIEGQVISAGTNSITIDVVSTNAVVSGVIKDGGTPITGLWGNVNATDRNGSWQWAPINPTDGSYSLNLTSDVGAGKDWYVSVWVDPTATAGNSSHYVYSGGEFELTNLATGSTTHDFTLTPTAYTISGTVTKPDTSAASYAWVYANNGTPTTRGTFDTGMPTNADGTYSINVPAGTYNVGVGLPPDLSASGLLPPSQQSVVVSDHSESGINFAFTQAAGHINGTVSLSGSGTSAFIWGWSEGGRNINTQTDASGAFDIGVSDNDIWHIGAVKETTEGINRIFYNSPEYVVTVGASATVTQNLTLNAQSQNFIGAVSETYDATTMRVITLADGTRIEIPAGALASSGDITVTATPKAESNKDKNNRPIGLAYNLAAFDSNGSLIEDFNSPVTITFPYTHEQLTSLGATEDALTVAYWDTNSSMWKAVASYSKDTTNNTITISTTHFSEWAPIGSGSTPKAQVDSDFQNVTAGTNAVPFVIRVNNPAAGATITSVEIDRPSTNFSIQSGSGTGWTPEVAGDNTKVTFTGHTIVAGAYDDFTVTTNVTAQAVDVTGATWIAKVDQGSGLTTISETHEGVTLGEGVSGGLDQNIRVLRVESVTITDPAGATDSTVSVGQTGVTVRVAVKNYGSGALTTTTALDSSDDDDAPGTLAAAEIAAGATGNFDFTSFAFDNTLGAHILASAAVATGAVATPNTASATVGTDKDILTTTVQSLPTLIIGSITSNVTKISKEAGATNTATITIPVSNSGQATSVVNGVRTVSVLRADTNADISSDFTITKTDSVVDVAGAGNANLTYTVTADTVTYEGSVKIFASVPFNDGNKGVAAETSPATDTESGVLAIDNAVPTFTSARFTSNTNLEVTYSENLGSVDRSKFTSATGFTTTAAAVTITDNVANITINALNNTSAAVADMAIAAGAATDTAGNASTQTLSNQTVSDGQRPTITSATTGDADNDGKIDKYTIIFSEDMDQSVTATTGYTVSGHTLTSGSWTNATTYALVINELGSADSNATPQLSYSDVEGDVKDNSTAHNQLAVVLNADITEIDGAGPVISTAVATDMGGVDGIQAGDKVTITFSEPTNEPTINAGNIDTVLALNGGHTWKDVGTAIGSATWTSSSVLTVILSIGSGVPTVAPADTITPSTAVKDIASSPIDAPAVAKAISGDFADHIVPTITSITTGDADNDGKIDEYTIVFSEAMTQTVTSTTGFEVAGYNVGASGTWSNATTFVLPITEGGLADTGVIPELTYTDASGDMKDASVATNQLGNVADGTITEVDGVGPVIMTAVATDMGGVDGIQAGDKVTITFSESTSQAVPNAGTIDAILGLNNGHTWKDVGNAIGSATWTSSSVLTVVLSIGSGVPTVAPGDTITPSGTIKDIAFPAIDAPAVAKAITGDFADHITPTIVSAITGDADFDGKIDKYTVVFSEAMTQGITSTGGYAVAGYTLGATGTWSNATTFILPIIEGSVDSGATPQLTYTDASGDMKDASAATNQLGNVANGDVTEDDGVGPVILTAVADDSGGNGVNSDGVQAGDKVVITFSEPTNALALNASNIDLQLDLNNDHIWLDGAGAIGSAVWSSENTILTVILSAGSGAPTIAADDTITPNVQILDTHSNVANNLKILAGSFDDLTAPTFTVQYYLNSNLSTSMGDNPYLGFGVARYLKITANEPLTGTPTISIDAEGSANDETDETTVSVSGSTTVFKYTQTLAHDVLAIGAVKESITITGTDANNNTATDIPPTNASTGEAYTDPTFPAIASELISSPVGGEVWAGGSTHTITWDPLKITDQNLLPTDPIEVAYYDGVQFNTLDYMSNTGSYSWTLPDDLDISNCSIGITAFDKAENHNFSGTLDFTIDSTPPMAPQVPDFVDDSGYRNIADKEAGIDAVVNFLPLPLGGAVGDTLELLVDGVPFPTPQTHVLNSDDLADQDNPYYLFTIPSDAWGDIADGTKTITANTTDVAGNVGVGFAGITFTLDTAAPVIAAHDTVTADATSSSGAVVTYTAPNATDNVDATAVATCSQASGSTFAIGDTTVTCNKTDAAGNAATATTFTVHVNALAVVATYATGDINHDGHVNNTDFAVLLYNWGTPDNASADLNSDGTVNNTDFALMLYNWS